jgi:hypothetical protein
MLKANSIVKQTDEIKIFTRQGIEASFDPVRSQLIKSAPISLEQSDEE